MLVDNERVVLKLKARLAKKRSWGSQELFALIAEIEVECQLDGEPDAPSDDTGTEKRGPLRPAAPDRPADGMPGHTDPLLAEGARDGRDGHSTPDGGASGGDAANGGEAAAGSRSRHLVGRAA